ncbi:MAG: hypothetical protein LBQ92_05940 [Propionibacteriaceae bacterium]|jgi:membrane-bound ClpP family serine protease|nr:hypothetical protein [Propionibacteriaceae bacterium]
MLGFVATTIAGAALLLIFLVFDGILDAVHIDFTGTGIISGTSIAGFITGIGLGGVIGTAVGWPFFAALALGFGLGFLIALAATGVYRLLRQAEAKEEDFDLGTMVGTEAVVTVGAEAGSTGLISARYLGSPRTLSFKADVPLRAGQGVIVAKLLGPELAQVEPIAPKPPAN